MRIFHIADLHIGKVVGGFSMLEDQIYILDQIINFMDDKAPDAVIIAGDVYDKPMPGAGASKAFNRFLTKIAQRGTAVMIISGNHDSPEHLGFAREILSESGVYICGGYSGALHNIRLNDEFGDIVFHMLPFIKPFFVRGFFEEPVESYQDAVRLVIESSDIDFSKRNILIAHQFFLNPGSDPERSKSEEDFIGGIGEVDINIVSQFDYVALGHLHSPQKIMKEYFRYAGSPLKYSQSECSHKKSIVMADIGAKGDIRIELLPLIPLRDMRSIKGPLHRLTSEEIIAQGNIYDYIYATLTDEDEIIDAMGKIRSVYPNVLSLSFDNSRTQTDFDLNAETDIEDISPRELFEMFFTGQNGSGMEERQCRIIEEILRKAGGS